MEKEAIRAMMEEEQKREEEQREKEEIARLRQEQVSEMLLHLLFIVLLWPFNFALMLLSCCLSNLLAFHVLLLMNRKVYPAPLLIPVTLPFVSILAR